MGKKKKVSNDSDDLSNEWRKEIRDDSELTTVKKEKKKKKKKVRRAVPDIVVSSMIDMTPTISDWPMFKSMKNVAAPEKPEKPEKKKKHSNKVIWFKTGGKQTTKDKDDLPSLKSLTPSMEELSAPPSSYSAVSDDIVVFDDEEINFFFNNSPHSSFARTQGKSITAQFENFYGVGDDQIETRITNRLVLDYTTIPPGKVYREWLPQLIDSDDVYHILQDIPGGLSDDEYFDRGINWLKNTTVIIISPAAEMKKHFWPVRMTFENLYTITANSELKEVFYIGEIYNKLQYTLLKGSHPMELYVFDFNCRVNLYMAKKMSCRLCWLGGHGSIPYHKIESWANGSEQQSKVFEIPNSEDLTTPLWVVADGNNISQLMIKGPKGILRFFYRPTWEETKKMEFTVYKMDGITEVGKIFRKPREDTVMFSSSWNLIISCAEDLRPQLKCGLISAAMLFRKEYMQAKRFGRSQIRYTGFRVGVISLVLIFIMAFLLLLWFFGLI